MWYVWTRKGRNGTCSSSGCRAEFLSVPWGSSSSSCTTGASIGVGRRVASCVRSWRTLCSSGRRETVRKEETCSVWLWRAMRLSLVSVSMAVSSRLVIGDKDTICTLISLSLYFSGLSLSLSYDECTAQVTTRTGCSKPGFGDGPIALLSFPADHDSCTRSDLARTTLCLGEGVAAHRGCSEARCRTAT